MIKYLGTRQRWWLHKCTNVLNTIELFTLKQLMLCNENFTSITKKKVPVGSLLVCLLLPRKNSSQRAAGAEGRERVFATGPGSESCRKAADPQAL